MPNRTKDVKKWRPTRHLLLFRKKFTRISQCSDELCCGFIGEDMHPVLPEKCDVTERPVTEDDIQCYVDNALDEGALRPGQASPGSQQRPLSSANDGAIAPAAFGYAWSIAKCRAEEEIIAGSVIVFVALMALFRRQGHGQALMPRAIPSGGQSRLGDANQFANPPSARRFDFSRNEPVWHACSGGELSNSLGNI